MSDPMEYRVTIVNAGSTQLDKVIEIADSNSRTLGHFPRNCFDREASLGRVIAAESLDGDVLGFALYRTTRTRAVVQMLCVDKPYQRRGIARKICDELKNRTSHLPGIVCHCAKEFDSLDAWGRLGFVPMGEKPGRGKTARPLMRLYYEHDHPHLFSESLHSLAEDTIVAVVDANVVIDMQDQIQSDLEIAAIQSDWLQEEVSLWVTDETLLEVARNENMVERKRRMAFIRGQRSLPRDEGEESRIYNELAGMASAPVRKQDCSDLRQLAQSIAGNADVFLTRDEALLRYRVPVLEHFGLEILRPIDLVVSLDKVARTNEYAPVRLHGTSLTLARPSQEELEAVIERFINHGKGEKKHHLADLVRQSMGDPDQYSVQVVRDQTTGPIALLVAYVGVGQIARISAFRVLRSKQAETLTRHILQMSVRNFLNAGFKMVAIDDEFAVHPFESSALSNGFVRIGDGRWIKFSVAGVQQRKGLAKLVAAESGEDAILTSQLCALVNDFASSLSSEYSDAEAERFMWPGMLAGSLLRTFVVPIKPRFAEHLFDPKLSEDSLFGGDPALLLNCENVYYRSCHIPVVTAPSRVLWYVSSDTTKVRELRAYSPVLSVHIGPANELFRRFKHLGVYEWSDVLAIAGKEPSDRVMAVHFGQTEVFPNAIPGAALRPMIARHRGSTEPPLSMPIEIPPSCFEEICEIAYDTST